MVAVPPGSSWRVLDCHLLPDEFGGPGGIQVGTLCPYSVVALGGLCVSCPEPKAIPRGDTPGEVGSGENKPLARALSIEDSVSRCFRKGRAGAVL